MTILWLIIVGCISLELVLLIINLNKRKIKISKIKKIYAS